MKDGGGRRGRETLIDCLPQAPKLDQESNLQVRCMTLTWNQTSDPSRIWVSRLDISYLRRVFREAKPHALELPMEQDSLVGAQS